MVTLRLLGRKEEKRDRDRDREREKNRQKESLNIFRLRLNIGVCENWRGKMKVSSNDHKSPFKNHD